MCEYAEILRNRLGIYHDSTLIDILKHARSDFCWVGGNADPSRRPEDKSLCPLCGKEGVGFQLDHYVPWRQYIVSFVPDQSPDLSYGYWVPRDLAQALYNDAENLWYICSTCNKHKSDLIADTYEELATYMNHRLGGEKIFHLSVCRRKALAQYGET